MRPEIPAFAGKIGVWGGCLVFDLFQALKAERLRRACGSLDRLKQIERGWLWPNGSVCHSA
jgi:hypothetical protein